MSETITNAFKTLQTFIKKKKSVLKNWQVLLAATKSKH